VKRDDPIEPETESSTRAHVRPKSKSNKSPKGVVSNYNLRQRKAKAAIVYDETISATQPGVEEDDDRVCVRRNPARQMMPSSPLALNETRSHARTPTSTKQSTTASHESDGDEPPTRVEQLEAAGRSSDSDPPESERPEATDVDGDTGEQGGKGDAVYDSADERAARYATSDDEQQNLGATRKKSFRAKTSRQKPQASRQMGTQTSTEESEPETEYDTDTGDIREPRRGYGGAIKDPASWTDVAQAMKGSASYYLTGWTRSRGSVPEVPLPEKCPVGERRSKKDRREKAKRGR
jgi:hypothetical protein